jgi:acyl phosphate:glycerol-3-phosphate acyltransferase
MKEIIYLLIFAYLLGSIPFALIVSKFKKVNLRKRGSGNIGATNIYRVMGLKYAILVFVLDAMKGYIPTYIALSVSDKPLVHILVGFTAIVGHSLTIWAKFKGGKGAATGLGMLLALSWDVFLIVAVMAIIIILITRYVSVATIICSISAPFLLYFLGYAKEYTIFIGIVSFFIIIRHKENIQRLIKRKENKV